MIKKIIFDLDNTLLFISEEWKTTYIEFLKKYNLNISPTDLYSCIGNFEKDIKSVTDYINDNIGKNLSIQTISKNTGLSKSSLYKKFHKYYNCTVSEYINKKRVENSKELLIKTDLSIEIIAQQVGFNSTQYYSKTFKEIVGISPNKYRKSKNKET